jgi:hypothetical protein
MMYALIARTHGTIMKNQSLFLLSFFFGTAGCFAEDTKPGELGGQEGEAFEPDADSDADTDADTDVDADTDADTDADADADADGDDDSPDGDDTGSSGDDTGSSCAGLTFSIEMRNPDTVCTECDSSEPFTVVGFVHNPCDDTITFEHSLGLDGSIFDSVRMWVDTGSTGHGGDCEGAAMSTEIAAGSSIETHYDWGLLSGHGTFPTEGEIETRVNFCTTDLPSERPGASVTFTSNWPPD